LIRIFSGESQPSLFDSSRAPAGQHTAWAYCHVPNGSTEDYVESIERQIVRYAPGFRDCILARHTHGPAELERYNPNYVGGDINSAHDASPFALQARLGDGTNFNPTMTATQSGSDTFNAIAVEIKAASAGTAPAAGIRIIKQQFYVSTALSVPGSWTEFFPAQGNLLVAANVLGGSTTSAITDSNSNMWTLAQNDPGYPAIQYAQNPTTDSTLRVTVPLTNINSNTTIALWDITGAATSGALAQSAVVADGAASNVSSFNNAPSITPVNQNGLILVVLAIGQGPMTGFASGAPASALFMPVTYPGETDFDTFDNADGYAHNYYGTSLAQQNYNWTLIPKASNSYQVSAVEFKADDTTPTTAPSGLTATAVSTSQINLAWTAATDNVGVTGYFVERCQGSKCTAFAQVARVTTTTYSNSALAAATSYRYRVRATDAAGNLSGFSKTASATTLGSPPPSTGPIAFLQGNYATPQAPTASVMVAYRAAQSAGDLNAVIVGWNDTTAAVIAVTDTMGNAYTLAVGPTVQPGAAGGGGLTQAIYYAKNILGAAANANTVTVRFSVAATYPDVRILEYSGLDRTNPLDVTAAAAGNSSTSDSGAVTTTNSNDLLVGGNMVWTITAGPGIGFTSRMITSPDGDIAEDQVVTSTGSYRATAPLSGAGPWVMQLVTFRAAGP